MPAPHVLYLAIGFPPAAKSSAHRLRATANELSRHGARVTVVNLDDAAWQLESGIDRSLLEGIEPSVDVLRLPLRRPELDPRIDAYGPLRVLAPRTWSKALHRRNEARFPEKAFGSWLGPLISAVEDVHRRDPIDLLLVTMAPYTGMAVATHMHERHGVPYALDYRDAWAVDVLGGEPAFPPQSREARIEERALRSARLVWFVNDAIADFYRQRYESLADRFRVVRNGSDSLVEPGNAPGPRASMTFGYVGTASYPLAYTVALLEGWALARERDPRIAAARLEFRGHFGFRSSGLANSHTRRIAGFATRAVSFAGPVPKGELGALYAGWDALVAIIAGGRFTTSGKIYEYMSTGMPIMSVSAAVHGAREVLEGYPLWVPPPPELDPEHLAASFIRTADLVERADDHDKRAAREHAARYERRRVLSPAVEELLSPWRRPAVADVPTGAPVGVSPTHDEAPRTPGGPAGRAVLTAGPTTFPRGRPGAEAVERVVMLGTLRPEVQRIRDAVSELDAHGVATVLVGAFDPRPLRRTGLAAARRARPTWGRTRTGSPRRFTPRWFWVVLRDTVVRRWSGASARQELLAAAVLDHELLREVQRADTLVALDPGAIKATALLARRYGKPARLGTFPVIDALPPEQRALAVWNQAARGRGPLPGVEVLEALSVLVPSGRERVSADLQAAPAVARRLRQTGQLDEAQTVLERTAALLRTPTARALAHAERLMLELEHARTPDAGSITAVARELLEDADERLAAGDLDTTIDLVMACWHLVFHRDLHAAAPDSPIAHDPRAFLAPLAESTTFAALRGTSGGTSRPGTVTARRLLVVTTGNLHFTHGILEDLESDGAEIDLLDLTAPDVAPTARAWPWTQMWDRLARHVDRRAVPLPDALVGRLEAADTIFVDWCDRAATWATFHAPPGTRVIVRVHSIDALSLEPHLVDWSRVDDVVFVGPHIRDLLLAAVPGISAAGRIHVVPNRVELADLETAKGPSAHRTLGLIGWAQQVKDPLWAADLLGRLRRHDPAWRLLLVGKDFAASQTPAGRAYIDRWRTRRDQDDVRDAIVEVPFTEDLSGVLSEIGVILSASIRESAHVALMEGAASGALPVVRNWPMFAPFDAARQLFPADWVVDSLDDAEARILAHASAESQRAAGLRAREWILDRADGSATRSAYRSLFGH